jgi:hypothetical protein
MCVKGEGNGPLRRSAMNGNACTELLKNCLQNRAACEINGLKNRWSRSVLQVRSQQVLAELYSPRCAAVVLLQQWLARHATLRSWLRDLSGFLGTKRHGFSPTTFTPTRTVVLRSLGGPLCRGRRVNTMHMLGPSLASLHLFRSACRDVKAG